nr:aladin isoform X1 [Ipomoea batatas]
MLRQPPPLRPPLLYCERQHALPEVRSFPPVGSVTICEINLDLITADEISEDRARKAYGKLLGTTAIDNLLSSDDIHYMLGALRTLGLQQPNPASNYRSEFQFTGTQFSSSELKFWNCCSSSLELNSSSLELLFQFELE